ncbi:phage tail terminator protein [Ruixingdingia sedimenti]|uniref:Uncharacterized protein n=1 Tax=Ruixingdingia sedimenti TaxID=3073604 RepID=A0ABU1FEW8_9RHOB|nr:hypothetical protein [Xinfangfangia sp. LG-4]MDR5655406.1 hypothetical protein [Xinfangfangia sp. LG-4]
MLAALKTRLETQLPTARWCGVEIAEDIDTFTDRAGLVDSGTAIVMPWGEQAQPQQDATGTFRQVVKTVYAIGIVIRHYDHLMGAARALQFDTYKADLEAALAGWEPSGALNPFELVGGESSPVTTGVSIYVQTWACTRILTGA